MNRLLPIVILLCLTASIQAQTKFRLDDASRLVDVELDVGDCNDRDHFNLCGPLTLRLFRKDRKASFQTIRLPRTNIWDNSPKANVTRRYDDQSVINFGDFNFDGIDDVAICDGADGGYGMPSYRVYLYSKTRKRFEYSRWFTRMNDGGLGMFETNHKKKMHLVYTKSTSCWHQTQGFDVFQGRPRMIYELTTDGTDANNPDRVKITTSKLIRGKWRTWIKNEKR